MLSGMNNVTEPRIVAAVSNAGGLGMLSCGRFTPDELRANLREIRKLTDKPFGVTLTLRRPNARDNFEVAADETVPVINYSLGKPWFIDRVHSWGGKVIGTVATSKHAVKAQELGVDALSITGNEAAAHGGEISSMVLIPIVADLVKVPFIAAGGFFDGRGLAAALMLGAGGISMGTRFIATQESRVHDNFKRFIIKASEEDTLRSERFDGMASRVLKTKESERMYRAGLPSIEAINSAFILKKELKLSMFSFLRTSLIMMSGEGRMSLIDQARQAVHVNQVKCAIESGDMEKGLLPAGQVIGGIHDIPTCKDLIERIVAEAEKTMKQISSNCILEGKHSVSK